jgi:hypothetical protein
MALTEFFISPSLMLDFLFFLVPVIVKKASPYACNVRSLLDCPIHTINNKTLCSHAAALEI